MLQIRYLFAAFITLILILTAACGGNSSSDSAALEELVVEEQVLEVYDTFDPSNFDNPTQITNQYFPLTPGIKQVLEGVSIEEGEEIPHRIEFTVTDLVKEINGIETVLVWIEDIADDELVEAEVAFYAQDNEGNVWFMGEYPEEYEEGELISSLSWIAGLSGAKPGIVMWANPQPGTPSYAQGWGPEIHWNDRAMISAVEDESCTPVDCYQDVLVIDEFNVDEPGIFQVKYYAPGVGNIRVGSKGDADVSENLELTELSELNAEEMALLPAPSVMLEKNGFSVDGGVYGLTPPSEVAGLEANQQPFEEFDPSKFDDSSANVTHRWYPLQPGTFWVYEGTTNEEGTITPHRIELTVTDLTKEVAGINTRVAYILDYAADELVEAEIAFYAQDVDGNVWYFGEYPEEYEEGQFVDAPGWIAGVLDAKPGIQMKADPAQGTPSYSQGLALSVDWTDRSRVFLMGQETCVEFGCYEDVLIADEFNNEEPGAYQLKYYAPEVGNVQVGWRGKDLGQEELELSDYGQLDAAALAEINAAALALEANAYEVSPDVYGQTEPMQ